MPINPQIPLQAQAPAMITPDKLLSLKMLTQQNQLGQMQVEDAMKARESNEQLRNVFSQPGATDASGNLSLDAINKAYGIDPKAGQTLATNRNKSLKEVAELAKLELENKAAKAKYLRDRLAGVGDQTSYDMWRMEASQLEPGAAGQIPPAFNPNWQRQNILTADKFIEQNTPKIEMKDVGGKLVPVDMNPVTNPAIKGTALDKTLSPEGKAADARGAATLAETRRHNLVAEGTAAATATAAAGNARNTQENQMRDDFTNASKKFVEVRDAHQRVIESAEDPSAAGDLSLIFNYMKVLDPGSTVREGEFATAQNAGGVDQRAVALYNRVVRGERLSNEQRTDFVDRSDRLYKGAVTNQEKIEADYEGKAKSAGARPEQVITKHRVTPKEKKALENPLSPKEQDELKRLRAKYIKQ